MCGSLVLLFLSTTIVGCSGSDLTPGPSPGPVVIDELVCVNFYPGVPDVPPTLTWSGAWTNSGNVEITVDITGAEVLDAQGNTVLATKGKLVLVPAGVVRTPFSIEAADAQVLEGSTCKLTYTTGQRTGADDSISVAVEHIFAP